MKQRAKWICGLVAILMLVSIIPMVSAEDVPKAVTETELAQMYAPQLIFASGEKVYPVDVEYFIQNCNLNQSLAGISMLIDAAPTPESLANYPGVAYSDYFLDNRLGTINDDRIIKAYQQSESSLGYTVYYRVTMDGSFTIIQYWYFYVFNFGTYNDHEGDWEMTQVVLDANLQPTEAMFSQHESGMRADWNDVETSGDHIKVYVAQGSHANYFRSYQGKTGFAQDVVNDKGKQLSVSDYVLIDLGEKSSPNPDPYTGWILFGGHWGDYGSATAKLLGESGPLGPAYRQDSTMWNTSINWGATLVVVSQDMLYLDYLYYNFIWIIVILFVIGILIVLIRLYRKQRKGDTFRPLMPLLEIKGGDKRSIANILAIVGIAIGIVGAFLPYYVASANIPAGQYETQGWFDAVTFSGIDGLIVQAVDDQGVPYQLAAIAVPFGTLLFLSMAMLVIGSIGVRRKRMPWRYIRRGIVLMLPIIFAVIIIASLMSMESMFNTLPGSEGAIDMLKEISKNPFGGSATVNVPDYGDVEMKWGFGLGAIVMVIAGVLLLGAGILYRMSKPDDVISVQEAPKAP